MCGDSGAENQSRLQLANGLGRLRWPTGERRIRAPCHSQARSAVFLCQAMKLASEGEDRSGGRESSSKTAKESSLLEPCLPGNPWKGSDDPLAESHPHSRW